jgi:hypothetical protein
MLWLSLFLSTVWSRIIKVQVIHSEYESFDDNQLQAGLDQGFYNVLEGEFEIDLVVDSMYGSSDAYLAIAIQDHIIIQEPLVCFILGRQAFISVLVPLLERGTYPKSTRFFFMDLPEDVMESSSEFLGPPPRGMYVSGVGYPRYLTVVHDPVWSLARSVKPKVAESALIFISDSSDDAVFCEGSFSAAFPNATSYLISTVSEFLSVLASYQSAPQSELETRLFVFGPLSQLLDLDSTGAILDAIDTNIIGEITLDWLLYQENDVFSASLKPNLFDHSLKVSLTALNFILFDQDPSTTNVTISTEYAVRMNADRLLTQSGGACPGVAFDTVLASSYTTLLERSPQPPQRVMIIDSHSNHEGEYLMKQGFLDGLSRMGYSLDQGNFIYFPLNDYLFLEGPELLQRADECMHLIDSYDPALVLVNSHNAFTYIAVNYSLSRPNTSVQFYSMGFQGNISEEYPQLFPFNQPQLVPVSGVLETSEFMRIIDFALITKPRVKHFAWISSTLSSGLVETKWFVEFMENLDERFPITLSPQDTHLVTYVADFQQLVLQYGSASKYPLEDWMLIIGPMTLYDERGNTISPSSIYFPSFMEWFLANNRLGECRTSLSWMSSGSLCAAVQDFSQAGLSSLY